MAAANESDACSIASGVCEDGGRRDSLERVSCSYDGINAGGQDPAVISIEDTNAASVVPPSNASVRLMDEVYEIIFMSN